MFKNSAKYFIGTILSAVVCSCTLMLEEPPVADTPESVENGDGITSPRVDITEYGKATYQFNEDVRVIDESYLPYLIKTYKDVVSDTTLNKTYLYFSKNIPTDMLPMRGDLISSHNVPMIDFALCDQVDAVEMEGNNYKVTSHVVALDKIFKVLEGDFIFDIVADGDSASMGNSRSGQESGVGAHIAGGYYRKIQSRGLELDILTGDIPLATVCVSSNGKTSPQPIFKGLNTDSWGKPVAILEKINHIKSDVSGSDCQYFLGQQFYITLAVKLTLSGIKVDVSSKVRTALGIDGKKFKGSTSMGVLCTDGSNVESDGFFPANSFNKYEYMLELPDILAIPITVGIPMTVSFGCSVINDMKYELDSSEKFHFETSYTDENFKFGATDKEAKVKKKKGGVNHQTNEHDGTVKFKYGTRNTFEINAGFTLGAGNGTLDRIKNVMKSTTLKGQLKEGAKEILKDQLPSFTPLVIRLIFTYKDVNFSDNSAVSPSTFQHNGRTYKSGGNSWRDRDLSIGVAASFLQVKGIGSVSGEVADATIDNYASKDLQQAYSILSKLNSLLSTSVASGSIWNSHTSKFATFKREIDDVDEDDAGHSYIYRITLTPNVIDETHESDNFYANRCFSNLQLFVLDNKNNIIAVGEPSGSAPGFGNKIVPEENAYQSIYTNKDYEFKFKIWKQYAIEGFKIVPAYLEWYNPKNPSSQFGWTKTYMFDIPQQIVGNKTAVKINNPKGRYVYDAFGFGGKPIGLLFDADFVLSEEDFKKTGKGIYVDVEGLDADGNVIIEGMFHAFKGEYKRNGTLKCLAILKMPEKRRLEKIVIRVMMSRWSTQFNKENYIEIGRSTFDFPFVPNGDEYFIKYSDIEKYVSEGYAVSGIY